MSIKDRGRIKWVSLMLPEHREQLEELKRDVEEEIELPLLDEQQLERLNNILLQSIEEGAEVEISFYEEKSIQHIRGRVEGYHSLKREILLKGDRSLSLSLVLDIEILSTS